LEFDFREKPASKLDFKRDLRLIRFNLIKPLLLLCALIAKTGISHAGTDTNDRDIRQT
jgi:hypothetical protein